MTAAVIIATYNGEKYIKEQIESILSQTRKVDKILISDDCSTDNTVEICNKIVKEHNGLIELHKNEKNLGYRKNFEQALIAARNYDIIFFCDQDDWWFPNKVEVVLTEFEKSENLTLFFSNAYLADENLNIDENKILFDTTFPNERRERFKKNPHFALCEGHTVTGCTMAIRNTIIEKVIPFSQIWVHDEWIAAIASILGEVKCTDEKLIKYRQNSDQNIGVKKEAVVRNRGFEKIKHAQSATAVNIEINLIDKELKKLYELNNFLNVIIHTKSKYIERKIKFNETLKQSFKRKAFIRIIFFISNTITGTYRYFRIPFLRRIYYIFLHIKVEK